MAGRQGGEPSHKNSVSNASSVGFAGGVESTLSVNLAAVCQWWCATSILACLSQVNFSNNPLLNYPKGVSLHF